MNVHQLRATGVGHVGDVQLSAGELVNQPAIDRAGCKFPRIGSVPQPRHVVEQPGELGARKVRIDHQTGFFREHRLAAVGLQPVAVTGGAAVLPHNGRVDRLAGLAVPDDDRFALIGNAQGRNVTRL